MPAIECRLASVIFFVGLVSTSLPAAQDCDFKLLAGDDTGPDRYGSAVSIAGNQVLVGASGDQDAGTNTGSAYFYDRVGERWVERVKVTASDAAAQQRFGEALVLSTNFALIGAPGDGQGAGAVYVFQRTGTGWVEVQKLVAADASAGDAFGSSIAVAGPLTVIGAPADDDAGPDTGSVYVFARQPAGWVEITEISASDATAGDALGTAVALSGRLVIAGAPGADALGGDAGAAYVFDGTTGVWLEVEKLTASAGAAGDTFGAAVGLDGDAAVVGAPFADRGTQVDTGAAFVFERGATGWMETAILEGNLGFPDFHFGAALDIQEERAVIGAPDDFLGRAYVFEKSAATWVQVEELVPIFCDCDDFHFATAVSLDGDLVLIGAPDTIDGSTAHIMELLNPGVARLDDITASDLVVNEMIGTAVALSGDRALLGAPAGSFISATGNAYVFERSGTNWVPVAHLPTDPLAATREFGWSVQLAGDEAFIGDQDPGTTGFGAGSVKVYSLHAGTWTLVQTLTASDAQPSDWFSNALALNGDTLMVAAILNDAGAVYVFERLGGVWIETQILTSANAVNLFGSSIALDGDRALIGSRGGAGAVHVFERALGTWSEVQTFVASDAGSGGQNFGDSLALSNDLAVVGGRVSGFSTGVAYIFQRGATDWVEVQRLPSADALGPSDYGKAVAISAGRIVVGSPREAQLHGILHVYEQHGTLWSEVAAFEPDDATDFTMVGASLAVEGDRVLSGAPGDAQHGSGAGAAYVLSLDCVVPFAIPYCFCAADSPCGNPAGGGCANSTGSGALLTASGSGSVVSDDLVLEAHGVPPHSAGVTFMGPADTRLPLGDGLLCVTPGDAGLFRFPLRIAGAAGVLVEGPGIVAFTNASFLPNGQIMAGQTWNFQTFYRDGTGPCGSAFNTSSAMSVTFAP